MRHEGILHGKARFSKMKHRKRDVKRDVHKI